MIFKALIDVYALTEGEPDKLKNSDNKAEKNGGLISLMSETLVSYGSLNVSAVERSLYA